MELSRQAVEAFQETIWRYYDQYGRTMPWREVGPDGTIDAYKIMVSEVMLQQTQVSRVAPKYLAFLERFPTIASLANAELSEVLGLWSGLGYNRRAKFLWQAAKMVAGDFGGIMPQVAIELQKLPGIGPNTAAAIAVYAYDSPQVFIETNIRTVYIHHFFADMVAVPDTEILGLVRLTLPEDHYREWYWALMDYGTYLKTTIGNLNKVSKHYTKQSKFEGSRRQLRGAVLRQLLDGPKELRYLKEQLQDDRTESVIGDLVQEGMVNISDGKYHL
jgi:A/G-specific adenine glycosylase